MKKALPLLLLALLAGCVDPALYGSALEGDGGADASSPELDELGRPKALFALSVTRTGGGTGSVTGMTGSNTIISCGSDCAETIILPTTVTLTATPTSSSSRFAGWSGGCTGTATTCTVTVGPAGLDVTARFELLSRVITYQRRGNGYGNVTATAGGATLFSCATASCAATVTHGTVVTLRATPNADARFDGWEGACTGMSTTCSVPMSAAKTVRARFVKTVRLEIVVSSYGRGGRVRSIPAYVLCPSDADGLNVCTYTLDAGTALRLSLIPSSLGRFASGPCASTDWGIESEIICDMTFDRSQRVDVEFSGITF